MARPPLLSVILILLIICNRSSGLAIDAGSNRVVVRKAASRLSNWAKGHEEPILFVDGNNVRGALNFQWSQPELMRQLLSITHGMNVVLVWDHGSQPAASVYEHSSMLVLFAGLGQTADDVIVQETEKIAHFQNDWSMIGIITNDAELKWRVQRACVRGRGTVLNHNKHHITGSPLLLDSKSFSALLNATTYNVQESKICAAMEVAVRETEERLKRHAALRRLRYNPRREQTWHRVVLAEALRSALVSSDNTVSEVSSNNAINSTFLNSYLAELQTRGYHHISSVNATQMNVSGPMRLDKRQRRQLQKYNKALTSGHLDSDPTTTSPYQQPSSANIAWWESSSKRSRRRHRVDKQPGP